MYTLRQVLVVLSVACSIKESRTQNQYLVHDQ